MKELNSQKQPTTKGVVPGKQRSYNEITEYLDSHWDTNKNDATLACIKQLDKSFDNVSQKLDTILVSGTNGKSLTIHFAAKLLQEESVSAGTFYAPHTLTYNERFSLNNEIISNKLFTELGNDVINTAEMLGLTPNSYDVLTMMALLYFKNNNVDVALLEVSETTPGHAVNICTPKVVAITRITDDITAAHADEKTISNILNIVKPGTHVVAADQSKLNLQTMQTMITNKGAIWSMPIRKLAALSYPFEQLHGRCAALAERIAYIYVNTFADKNAVVVNSLLAKKNGLRGRPTREAKRLSEQNPKKTIDQFWKETINTLPGRFQLLDKEKPTILLDNAGNLDAFENVLLGIRLLHYQRPLKGLTVILGCNQQDINMPELLKMLRYFFKKTSGQVIVCPVEPLPGHKGHVAWDVEKVTNDIKIMKIKAKSSKNFQEAFEMAEKSVDERHGLVVITGSPSIVSEYWKYKGIKKL
jgi:folylpolyglutamate synthase/dihydrofolate synthase